MPHSFIVHAFDVSKEMIDSKVPVWCGSDFRDFQDGFFRFISIQIDLKLLKTKSKFAEGYWIWKEVDTYALKGEKIGLSNEQYYDSQTRFDIWRENENFWFQEGFAVFEQFFWPGKVNF